MGRGEAKTKQKSKGCCFCGSSGPMSKEHIWAVWAADLLPASQDYHREKITGWGPEGRQTHLLTRQGSTKTIRIPVVCKKCNGGWMGDMEDLVAPLLRPMSKGQRIDLDGPAQANLAAYFTMKAMVADLSRTGEHIFWSHERADFFTSRKIPEGTSVHLARYQWEPDPLVQQYNKESRLARSPDGPADHRFGVANQTIRFGELFVQVLTLRQEGIEPIAAPGSVLSIHPPKRENLRWPPLVRLQPNAAYVLQHVLEFGQLRPAS